MNASPHQAVIASDGDRSARLGQLILHSPGLFTDLYELTMAASYLREGMQGAATFSLFVRDLPSARRFLVAAGLGEVLDLLGQYRFSHTSIGYLRSLGIFEPVFLDWLGGFRFDGDVRAVPEGTVVFANEPILEVTAPIPAAQLVETLVLNIVHLHTVLASKAARVVRAARGRPIVEFGLRRTLGTHAGLAAARSAFLVGAQATSNVLAGMAMGIPVRGTMAHSYIEAFPSERDAFSAFADAFPDGTVLLIDTYDTAQGARHATEVARALADRGHRLVGVRLDSGDLNVLSHQVRRILDRAGFPEVTIFASGGLDEYEIDRLLSNGAPIDAFGVGTRMTTSSDAPSLDLAYKIVAYERRPVMKLSEGKATWPLAKQVYRFTDVRGRFIRDRICASDEPPPDGADPLLTRVMVSGRTLGALPSLADSRDYCAHQVSHLPSSVTGISGGGRYPVEVSSHLRAVSADLATSLRGVGAAAADYRGLPEAE